MSQTVGQLVSEVSSNSMKESDNVQQEVNDLIEIIKLEREKFHSYKILCDLAYECAKNCNFKENEKSKIENILLAAKVQPCINIEKSNFDDDQTSTVLGLSTICTPALNYDEKYKLKTSVQQALGKKYSALVCELAKTTGQHCDSLVTESKITPNLSLSLEDKVLYESKMQLNKQRDIYYENLLEYYNILKDFIELRTQSLPNLCHKKVEECSLLSKMYELRVRLINEKLRKQIFMETGSSVISYKELIKQIKEQQKEEQDEIQKLETMKEKYKQVSCAQFNAILASYKNYFLNVKKLKSLCGQLNLK